jgi:hypothetical protein
MRAETTQVKLLQKLGARLIDDTARSLQNLEGFHLTETFQ